MTEIVYRGHDNRASITVLMDGAPMDFSTVTRMTLELPRADVVVDSDQHPGAIDWSGGAGLIEFDLGDLSLPCGLHRAILVAYDPLHPNGQVIAHPAGAELRIRVV